MIARPLRRPPFATAATAISFAGAVVLLGACSGDDEASPATSMFVVESDTPAERAAPGESAELADSTAPNGADTSSTAAPSVTNATAATLPPATAPPISTTSTTPPSVEVTVPEGGGESLGPLGETEVELETDEGTVQIGTGEVPEGAATLPVPDDFDVQLVSETATDVGVTGTTSLSFDEVMELYETDLPAAGYAITERSGADGIFVVFEFESATRSGDVLIATTPGSDDLTVTLALADR